MTFPLAWCNDPARDLHESEIIVQCRFTVRTFSCRVTNNKLLLEFVCNNLVGNYSRRYALHDSPRRENRYLYGNIGTREIIEKSRESTDASCRYSNDVFYWFTYKVRSFIFMKLQASLKNRLNELMSVFVANCVYPYWTYN